MRVGVGGEREALSTSAHQGSLLTNVRNPGPQPLPVMPGTMSGSRQVTRGLAVVCGTDMVEP